MAQGSRQVQSQVQQQVQTLSPQQILVVKLLELPAVELEDRVRAELLENPALEEGKEETAVDDLSENAVNADGEFGYKRALYNQDDVYKDVVKDVLEIDDLQKDADEMEL